MTVSRKSHFHVTQLYKCVPIEVIDPWPINPCDPIEVIDPSFKKLGQLF